MFQNNYNAASKIQNTMDEVSMLHGYMLAIDCLSNSEKATMESKLNAIKNQLQSAMEAIQS